MLRLQRSDDSSADLNGAAVSYRANLFLKPGQAMGHCLPKPDLYKRNTMANMGHPRLGTQDSTLHCALTCANTHTHNLVHTHMRTPVAGQS